MPSSRSAGLVNPISLGQASLLSDPFRLNAPMSRYSTSGDSFPNVRPLSGDGFPNEMASKRASQRSAVGLPLFGATAPASQQAPASRGRTVSITSFVRRNGMQNGGLYPAAHHSGCPAAVCTYVQTWWQSSGKIKHNDGGDGVRMHGGVPRCARTVSAAVNPAVPGPAVHTAAKNFSTATIMNTAVNTAVGGTWQAAV